MNLNANEIMKLLENESEQVWESVKQARKLRATIDDSIAQEALKDTERILKAKLKALENFRKVVELAEEIKTDF